MTASPWCADCGHPVHEPGHCTYKMPWSRVMQMIGRGALPSILPRQPDCDCDHKRGRTP